MTLIIEGYEVEVKAKQTGKKSFTKKDTQVFLNHIAANLACTEIWLEDSENENAEYWAGRLYNIEKAIHDKLDAQGFYKKRGL